MHRRRVEQLKEMAKKIAELKNEHVVSSSELYRYLKFRLLIERLCDLVRLRSGGRISIGFTGLEKAYYGIEQAAVWLLRHHCDVIAADLGFPIADDVGSPTVSFQFDWKTPRNPLVEGSKTAKDLTVPAVFVSLTAVVRAIVEAGGINQPEELLLRLPEEGWLRLRHRGRISLYTFAAFESAVLSRRDLIREDLQARVAFRKAKISQPELIEELGRKYGREPSDLEVWRVVQQEELYESDLESLERQCDFFDEPGVWNRIISQYETLHKRAQLEQTTGRYDTQRAILAAYFGYLGEGGVDILLAEARRRLDRRIEIAEYYSGLTGPGEMTPELERCKQLRHWIDRHERWLMQFLTS